MISINLVWIFFLAAFAGVFIALGVLSIVRLRYVEEENRSFMRLFPCELMKENIPASGVYRILLFTFSGLCFAPVFVVLPLLDEFGGLGAIAMIISFLFGLEGLVMVSIFLFNIRYTNTHTKLSTAFMAGSFLVNGLTTVYAILTYTTWNKFDKGSPLTLVMAILAGLLTIATLVITLNPKLKNWAQLVKSGSGEEVTYSRPKIFPLAFSEWLLILINFLSEIIFLISLIR